MAGHLAASAEDRGLAPPVAPSPPAALTIPGNGKGGSEIARPVAPGRTEAPRRNPWPIVILFLALIVVAAVAGAAYFWRETPQELAIKAASPPPDKTAPVSQNKIAERINGDGQSDAASGGSETPIPTVTVPVAPVPLAPTPTAPAAPSAPATGSAAPAADVVAQASGPPQAQLAPAATIPVASRAAMLIASASDPQKPTVNLGNAVWSLIPAVAGQPGSLAIRIDIEIPDQKMRATVTIRKNADASLPATHTIDLRATFADGAQIKGLKDMALPQLRKDDSPTGEAIAGVRVKINDSYYLVGLTRSDTDAAHNLDLLATQSWFDFPVLLNDDRIAKLTFEKGVTGDRVMAQALTAWK